MTIKIGRKVFELPLPSKSTTGISGGVQTG